jgi:alpha-beta hydrolase superfamily lysophospholipase
MHTHTTFPLLSGTIAHNWKPSGPSPPRAILILQHGFGEYAERYATSHSKFIPRLTELGIEVWGLDLQGHGLSPGARGVVDIHAAVRDHVWLVGFVAAGADASMETDAAAGSTPNVSVNKTSTPPILLFGHSLGGLVTAGSTTAILTASQKLNNSNATPSPTPRINGVLLTSPVLPFPNSNTGQILISTLASLLLRLIAFFFPNREVPTLPGSTPPPSDTLRGENEAVQMAADDEMLFRGGISWTAAASALGVVFGVWRGVREGLWGRQEEDEAGNDNGVHVKMDEDVNVLVLHGRWDPWSDWRGSLSFVEGIQRSRTQIARPKRAKTGKTEGESEDGRLRARLVVLDTSYHELLNAGGSTGEEVLRVILEWIDARIADGYASPISGVDCEPRAAGQ